MTIINPPDESMPREPVVFTGKAGEWFGIWIVNLLLSIITIGIYSAWAKVRRNKYFYGNTSVGGRKFDYHATGMQILIGRLIVIGAYIVFNILVALTGPFGLILVLGLLFLVPWLIIRATKFGARNTSWSNVRFDFEGDYWDAFITFILLPIGVALTLYTTLPFLSRRINRFVINGHKLGNHPFRMAAPIGGFYVAAGLALAWTVAAGLIAAVLFGGSFAALFNVSPGAEPDPVVMGGLIAALYASIFLVFLPAAVLYGALVRNVVYQHSELEGGHRFTSTVKPFKLLWIAVSNLVVVICTLGLMLPWAQIRMSKYLADQTFVRPNGSLDEFAGQVQADGSAIGDAFGDFEGIDVGAGAF